MSADETTLRTELERLWRALIRYGRHKDRCVQVTGRPCTCGYDATMAQGYTK